MTQPTPKSFTGRSRRRTTHRRVLLADKVSKWTITLGGIGTIVAVLGVFAFLLYVVAPLFMPARITEPTRGGTGMNGAALHVAADEYQTMAWVLMPSGKIQLFRLDNGQQLAELTATDQPVASASFVMSRPDVVLGLADGSIVTGRIAFDVTYLDAAKLPDEVRKELESKPRGQIATFGQGIAQLTPDGQVRAQQLKLTLNKPVKVADAPIARLAHVVTGSGQFICFLTESGGKPQLKAVTGEEKSDFLTGAKSLSFGEAVTLPLEAHPGVPTQLAINGNGSEVYIAWEDGWLQRVQAVGDPAVLEQGRLIDGKSRLTAMRFILGNNTLVWGDSAGRVAAGFTIRIAEIQPAHALREVKRRDGVQHAFAITKHLEESGPALTAVAASGRSRLVLGGFADGSVRLYNVTTEDRLGVLATGESQSIERITFTPKADGLLALAAGKILHSHVDPGFPEARPAALFNRVWYEGYSQPTHMYQSSSGDDEAEPKLGMIPLIFGTIKATFYSMLFGAPIALLAAIFSSEFLKPRVKAVVKPTIELMASLPSVVLGFLAALVFAPFIELIVPSVIALFICGPLAFLVAAYLWQLLPTHTAMRLAGWRLPFMIFPLIGGFVAATAFGPLMEDLLFAGDFRGWTAFDIHAPGADTSPFRNPLGGWVLILLPFAALTSALLISRFVTPWLREKGRSADRPTMAWLDLAKFALGIGLTLAIAFGLGSVLGAAGFDVRGELTLWGANLSPIHTYVQRNSLIVGFVMGFAVIPIIYTIADDALSSVPEHLRSASLGAGATVWQTAVRVVIPTAMSGLFSALMVGLGRAVGETMIVLMATGNTPIMDLNIFNGFRTLSANIAVELPEAVKGSTHYRTLFLAALVLFAMTFAVNTVAESIRQRFRKRAYQL